MPKCELVEHTRKSQGRKKDPTVGTTSVQSVKNTLTSCKEKGFDMGKKVKGINGIL